MHAVKQSTAVLLLALLLLGMLIPVPGEETALQAPTGLWTSSDSDMNDLGGTEEAVAVSDAFSCSLPERLHSQAALPGTLSTSATLRPLPLRV
jgi:hypothetical protein